MKNKDDKMTLDHRSCQKLIFIYGVRKDLRIFFHKYFSGCFQCHGIEKTILSPLNYLSNFIKKSIDLKCLGYF